MFPYCVFDGSVSDDQFLKYYINAMHWVWILFCILIFQQKVYSPWICVCAVTLISHGRADKHTTSLDTQGNTQCRKTNLCNNKFNHKTTYTNTKYKTTKMQQKYKTTNTNTNKRQIRKQNQRKSYHLKGDVSPTAHERADRQYPSDIEQV